MKDLKKSRAVLCQGVRARYRFMNEHRHTWPLTTMRCLLQIARAGCYQWLYRPESDHSKEDARLLALIRDSLTSQWRGLWVAPSAG